MQVESRLRTLDQRLEVTVHLLLGFAAEDLTQHHSEHGELVRVVGQPELTGN